MKEIINVCYNSCGALVGTTNNLIGCMEGNIFNISAFLGNSLMENGNTLQNKETNSPIIKCANDDPNTITQPYPPSGAVVTISSSRSPSCFSLPDYEKIIWLLPFCQSIPISYNYLFNALFNTKTKYPCGVSPS